jgi:purine catabolism regulator
MTTGLGIPERPADQVEYVTQLHAHGISGIAIGEGMSAPDLSNAMLRTADELGLPVLATKREIPFISIARAVASSNAQAEQERLARTERIYELTRAHLSGDDEEAFLEGLGNQLDADVAVVRSDQQFEPRPGSPIAPEEQSWVVEKLTADSNQRLAQIRLDDDRFALPIAGGAPTALVLRPRSTGGIDIGLAQHAATVVTARLSIAAAEFSREGQLASALLGRLMDAEVDALVAQDMLSVRGLKGSFRLYTWNQVSPIDTGDASRNFLAQRAIPNLLTVRDGRVVLLAEESERAQHAVGGSLPEEIRIGISSRFVTAGELPFAFREAKLCLSRAVDLDRRIVRFDDDDVKSVFLPHDRPSLEYVVSRVLGDLIAYDDEKNSQLLLSLRVFLEENRSWMRASARLFVHKQTLVYRIDRIEEITNRKLSSMADVAELWLAVQAATAIRDRG